MMLKSRQSLTRDEAETLAFQAMAFLAEEPERLGRFLSLTGLGPDDLRRAMTTPALQVAILGHLLSDESLLLVFAATAGVPPEKVGVAERLLGS